MKVLINLFIGLFFLAGNVYSQKWITTEITDFASIDFPSPPDKDVIQGKIVYSTTDSLAVYIVAITKLSDEQKSIVSAEKLPEFYRGVVNGAIEASKGTLLSKTDFKKNGIEGVEISYIAASNPELPELRFKRLLFVNQTLISYEIWTTTEMEDLAKESKNKYFNSLTVNLTEN